MSAQPRTEPAPAWLDKSDHARRLLWRYGPDRALQIIAGLDDATNADLAKWRSLGTGGAA